VDVCGGLSIKDGYPRSLKVRNHILLRDQAHTANKRLKTASSGESLAAARYAVGLNRTKFTSSTRLRIYVIARRRINRLSNCMEMFSRIETVAR
jgi:hypothetical protein